MYNDPMIEKYKRELLEFSRRHPKFTPTAPEPEDAAETVSEPEPETAEALPVSEETVDVTEQTAERIVPVDNLYRDDFGQDVEAVTTAMRLANVTQREQVVDPPQTAETAAQTAAVAVHSDQKEMEFAACDRTDPPYCNGTIATFDTREAFLEANPGYGYLRVQVSVAQQAYPVQNATVEISKTFSGEKVVFFSSQTDASGIVSRVTLPAPDRDLSSAPSALQPYATYDIFVSHPNFTDVYVPNCIVFATIETIQQVRMVPLETCEENPDQSFCEEG